ncbi:hypothetical protein SAV31267_061040 [Streptomyces avermitilis]|uniref:Adenylate cyclase regulatory domain-containing protein n=1 Tax=Streptomyces avermitilis TaxID=33903 RepID=A0A4D4MZ70_STRAX|nr:hypothetical protein SAV31267_061040 [Streptomyces avermitilis]
MTVDDTGSGTGVHPAPDGEPGPTARPVSDASPARVDAHGGRTDAHDRVDGHEEPEENPLALRLEQLILGAERRYTPFQAARSAGVSMELASRFWRAMGFADIGQAKALTEADVLALRRLAGLVEAGLLSEAMAVQVARSTGQTTARLAEWQIDSFLEGLTEPPEPGMTRTEVTYPSSSCSCPSWRSSSSMSGGASSPPRRAGSYRPGTTRRWSTAGSPSASRTWSASPA